MPNIKEYFSQYIKESINSRKELKILIMDDMGIKMMNRVCNTGDTYDMNTALIEQFDNKREPMLNFHAVYYIEPLISNIEQVIKENVKERMYKSCTIYLTDYIVESFKFIELFEILIENEIGLYFVNLPGTLVTDKIISIDNFEDLDQIFRIINKKFELVVEKKKFVTSTLTSKIFSHLGGARYITNDESDDNNKLFLISESNAIKEDTTLEGLAIKYGLVFNNKYTKTFGDFKDVNLEDGLCAKLWSKYRYSDINYCVDNIIKKIKKLQSFEGLNLKKDDEISSFKSTIYGLPSFLERKVLYAIFIDLINRVHQVYVESKLIVEKPKKRKKKGNAGKKEHINKIDKTSSNKLYEDASEVPFYNMLCDLLVLNVLIIIGKVARCELKDIFDSGINFVILINGEIA
jgi:hypothetical protein